MKMFKKFHKITTLLNAIFKKNFALHGVAWTWISNFC